ncbi:GroES-like protein [Hypoxylon sp. NC1633]|nr:GroES-like protein [Hypoxylon sp. NC1633]
MKFLHSLWRPISHWKSRRRPTYTAPGPNELVVRNRVVAINLSYTYKQLLGDALLPYITWLCVIDEDVAGDVVQVGSAVTSFKAGDRIIGYAAGTHPYLRQPPIRGRVSAKHCPVHAYLTALFLESISYERACVLVSWAGCTTVPAAPPNGEAVVITSSASSVGTSAIQLAVAADYEVYSRAPPGNFELHQNIADAGPSPLEGHPEGVKSRFIDLLNVGDPDAVIGRMFRDFVPRAPAKGQLVPEPELLVVGNGLESIQGYSRLA